MNPWIVSLRLRTLPLAISVVSAGAVLAFRAGGFSWGIYLLAVLTAIMLQILSNLANEYGDYEKGTDNDDREGPKRSLQSGVITKESMKSAIVVAALFALFSGLALLYTAFQFGTNFWVFLFLGILSIIGAINYTVGDKPYGYHGLGDVAVFIFFGVLGVMGSYYLFTEAFDGLVFLPAITVGLFSTAVLNVNNIRDLENDEASGKRTLAVRLGVSKSIFYHWALLELGWWSTFIYTYMTYDSLNHWLWLLVTPLLVINAIAVRREASSKSLDPYLKQMVISTLLFVLLFSLGILLAA